MKLCFKCGLAFPLSEFYAHDQMEDGHLGKCKECTKLDARDYRANNLEHVREHDRDRAKRPHEKARRIEYQRRHRMEHPERHSASQKARRALRAGKIEKRPCHFCLSEDNLEMHHPDYSKPLRVYWLCRTCHRKLDGMMKIGIET